MMWTHYKAEKVVKVNMLHDKGAEYKSPICPPHVIHVLDLWSAASPSNTHTTPFLLRVVIILCAGVCWLTLLKGAMEGIAAQGLAVCCQTYSTSYIHFHFQYWTNSVEKSHSLYDIIYSTNALWLPVRVHGFWDIVALTPAKKMPVISVIMASSCF